MNHNQSFDFHDGKTKSDACYKLLINVRRNCVISMLYLVHIGKLTQWHCPVIIGHFLLPEAKVQVVIFLLKINKYLFHVRNPIITTHCQMTRFLWPSGAHLSAIPL